MVILLTTKAKKANATARLQEVVTDAQYSLDLAFAAGTLATTAGIALTQCNMQKNSKMESIKRQLRTQKGG